MILIIQHARKHLTIEHFPFTTSSTMDSSQLYIFQNKSFRSNVLKIGMTKRGPDSRAKEIYTGATGVPEQFDVLFACSVADCRAAETRAHRRLAAYRINDSREFFRIPADVARRIVLDVCAEVNTEHQCEPPAITVDWITRLKPEAVAIDQYEEKYGEVHEMPIDSIVSSPLGTCKLSELQKHRLDVVGAILAEVYSDPDESWHDSFSREQNPEPELRIWEHIAKAYLKIDNIDDLSKEAKHEAYSVLLHRSLAPSKRVLEETVLQHITEQAAKKIMAGYELAPRPVIVKKIKAQEEDEVKVIHPKPMIAAIQNIFARNHPRKPG
jgi:hypothetical protein